MNQVITIGKDPIKKKTITERHIYTQELITALKAVKEEQVISYDDLSKIIGMNVRPQKQGYTYQYSARKILERENDIAFEVINTVGLRRLTPEEVANGTGSVYLKGKRSLIRRSKRRIKTIDDHYDDLSNEAKMKVTVHRTILAFDNEVLKPKRILKIEDRIKEHNKLIGFQDTIKLFEK